MAEDYQSAFQEWLSAQSGYVGKTKKAEFKQDWQTQQGNNASLNNLFSNGPTNFGVSGGSVNEQQGRIQGLQRAKILTGQNPYQIGQDYQEAYGNIKKRVNGSDTGSELLRANKAGAVSETRDQLQAQGVKGGAAAGAVASVERQKSYDINNQIIQNQRQAQSDYLNATKANANFTQTSEMNYGALAAGKDMKAPPQNSNGFGNLGTVICTELFRQGLMDRKTFIMDVAYGIAVSKQHPDVYWGYRFVADPIVKSMKKSKAFTHFVSFCLTPWTKHMAGETNAIGMFTEKTGFFICGLIGRYILGVSNVQKAYVK